LELYGDVQWPPGIESSLFAAHKIATWVPPLQPLIALLVYSRSWISIPVNCYHPFGAVAAITFPSTVLDPTAGVSARMFRHIRHDTENTPPSPSFFGTAAEAFNLENQIILQCFNWDCWRTRDPSWWTILKFKAATIADAGITACWLPPASAAVDQQVRLVHKLLVDMQGCLFCQKQLYLYLRTSVPCNFKDEQKDGI
jgi:hypothetical protein